MSTCTQAIAHSVMDARHLHKATTLPQCSLCMCTPDHHHHHHHHLMFPGLLFLSSPLLSPGPLWKLDVLLNVLCVHRRSDSCFCYILHKRGTWMWIYCLPLFFVCSSVRYDDHACQVPRCRYLTCVSDFFSSLLSGLSCFLASHTDSRFSSEVNTYWAFMKRKMAASF